MSNIVNYTPVPLSSLMANITQYRYNPSNIQRVILSHLSDVTNGVVDIVDPTNPFIFLLEASSVCTAAAITENDLNTQRQYPALANSIDDIYLHMSDVDYINRFASPSDTIFSMLIQLNSLKENMVDSPSEECAKVTIPRNTFFTVNGMVFSLQYPIDIKVFYNGAIQIEYVADVISPLQALTTNIIDHTTRTDPNGLVWLYFDLPITQFNLNTQQFSVMASTYFSDNIAFTDQYYYCRAYYKNSNSTGWVEMLTTHTEQVFDYRTPTMVLKVLGKTLNVSIPQVYINANQVDGDVRIDVYTTKGELNVNMINFSMNSFKTSLYAVDEYKDTSAYTAAMNNVAMIAYCDKLLAGGGDGLTFEQLRAQVISNSTGPRTLPITNQQLISSVNNYGFSIVKDVDVVTNRIFLATKPLPAPSNPKLITAATLSIDTLINTFEQLSTLSTIKNNGTRLTITPDTLYLSNNGIITVYPDNLTKAIFAMLPSDKVSIVNKNKFIFSPFHYVLDNTSDEFITRAYYLNSPIANGLSFISQNPTALAVVNTASYGLVRIDNGYKLTIITKSDDMYKSINDANKNVQLAFIPTGETVRAYVNGTLLNKTGSGESIFEFELDTNFDIDNLDNLYFTNFKMFNTSDILSDTPLKNKFEIFYTTNSVPVNFRPDNASTELGLFMLPANSIAITKEVVDLTLGLTLSDLWTNSRSVVNYNSYQTYSEDVPLYYAKDVYKIDPTTNSIFSFTTPTEDGATQITYNILNHAGDPVLNPDGTQVYSHRAGDVMLDDSGNPIPSSGANTLRHVDMLFLDGVYYFTTDPAYRAYIKEVADVLSGYITVDLVNITNTLLEQTRIYYYAKRELGLVKVLNKDSITTTIESSQSFVVNYYVSSSVYGDINIRNNIINKTVNILNSAVAGTTIAISDVIDTLKATFGTGVIAVSVTGLGGKANYDVVTLVNDQDALSLNKILVELNDGSLIAVEDVTVNFYDHSLT
jgi:hypothetical protein